MTVRRLALVLATSSILSTLALGSPVLAQEPAFPTDRVPPSDVLTMKASFAPVVRAAAPAVVNISARGVRQVQDPFWAMFGAPPQAQRIGSVGSGVIVRPEGVIVTNAHVIENMLEIRVTLNDRREYAAQVVLADERSDIAVLQLEGVDSQLPTLDIDDREEQQVGDLVLAIGNPFGVGQTVTNGIISALNRTETGISDSGSFIQTDAAINPGNSGGALVDMDGDLIGINTAIFSRSGGSSGVGFATPASMVRRVVDSAVGGASAVVRPWLGVRGETVSAEIARSLDMSRPQGLIVTDVWPSGPAERAGLLEGDIITAIDGAEINDQGGLNFRVGTHAPRETVQVAVLREGQPLNLTARVETLPGDPALDRASLIDTGALGGVEVVALNPALADSLGGDPFLTGVILARVPRDTYARGRLGLMNGDVILAVNGRAASTPQHLQGIQRGMEVTVERRGQRATMVIR